MTLTTERLILRPWEESDAEDLYEYAKDERVGPVAGWPAHSGVEESLQVIRTVLSAPENYAVCLKEDGRAVGCAALTTGERSNMGLPEGEGEIGYWIGVPFWGRGLIPEAVRELTRRAFEDLGYETLWCGYFEGNDKSRRVQEKCGFTYHHTNRDIHWKMMDDIRTEHIMRLTKEEWERQKGKQRMEEGFDLQKYLTEGVEQVVKDALKATLKDPRESAFLAKFALACAAADKKREKNEKDGLHVPSYLIASITSVCNLHCEGCYSRANDATKDCEPVMQLSGGEWLRIFREAEELGVSFILLAGGEPMLRWDVIEAAGEMKDIMFPVFTNGTFMGEKHLDLLDRCRNIVPVISMEGSREVTDSRRGEGVYDTVMEKMDILCSRGVIFGVSVTVTRENMDEVLSDGFLDELRKRGCKAVFYIEYVPVDEDGSHLAPGEAEREVMAARIEELRSSKTDMIYISFPGDEKSSGGCLAAGRGFFHINSHGGAEPCPFSPYSDINVRDTSLREALQSDLFTALRSSDILADDHIGGCVLHEKKDQVEALLSRAAR